MSSKKYQSEPLPEMQEVDLNDAEWDEVVRTRLPANLEAHARRLQAWSRKREVRSVPDLLRALLVYATGGRTHLRHRCHALEEWTRCR